MTRDIHYYLPVHAWLERAVKIVEADEHRKHRHARLHDRLGLDLLDYSDEATIRKCIDGNSRRLTGHHASNVGLVDERAHPDFGQVCHLQNRRTATRRSCRRSDHHPLSDGLLDDCAVRRCADSRILEPHSGDRKVCPRFDQRRVGVGESETRLIHLLRRDDLLLVQLGGAIALRQCGRPLYRRRAHVRRRLIVLVSDVAGIDLDQQISCLHVGADIHGHFGDRARRLRFDFDDVDRLDGPICLHAQHDAAPIDASRLDRDRRIRRLLARTERENQGDAAAGSNQPVAISRLPVVFF